MSLTKSEAATMARLAAKAVKPDAPAKKPVPKTAAKKVAAVKPKVAAKPASKKKK